MGCCASVDNQPPEGEEHKGRGAPAGGDDDSAAEKTNIQNESAAASAAPSPQKRVPSTPAAAAPPVTSQSAAVDESARNADGSAAEAEAAEAAASQRRKKWQPDADRVAPLDAEAAQRWQDGGAGSDAKPPVWAGWVGVTAAPPVLSALAQRRDNVGLSAQPAELTALMEASANGGNPTDREVVGATTDAFNRRRALADAESLLDATAARAPPAAFSIAAFGRDQVAAEAARELRQSVDSSLHQSISRSGPATPASPGGAASGSPFSSRPPSAQGPRRPLSAHQRRAITPNEQALLAELEALNGSTSSGAGIVNDNSTSQPPADQSLGLYSALGLSGSTTAAAAAAAAPSLGYRGRGGHGAMPSPGTFAPVMPAVAMLRESPRDALDSDEDPLSDADVDMDRHFRVGGADDAGSRRRHRAATGSASPQLRDGEGTTTATAHGGLAREATPGFVALEEDCRRVMTGQRARREFLESAPRWTPTRSREGTADDDGLQRRHTRRPHRGGGEADLMGLPPRGPGARRQRRRGGDSASSSSGSSGDDIDEKLARVGGGRAPTHGRRRRPVGVAAADEFMSEQRQLLAIAAPELALGMEESVCRDDICATWGARAHAAYCGVQSAVLFLEHRRELEVGLDVHAAVLRLCCEHSAAVQKSECYMRSVRELAATVYASKAMAAMLQRKAFERSQVEAEERLQRVEDAAREAALLAKRSQARAWEHEKAALSNRAAKSHLAANRSRVAALEEAARQDHHQGCSRDPVRKALEDAVAKAPPPPPSADDFGSTMMSADGSPSSPMGAASSVGSLASFASGGASGGAVSFAKRRATRHRQRVLNDEERQRAAISTEEESRLGAMVAEMSRYLPIGPDGAELLAARRAAEVAAAKQAAGTAQRKADQLSIDAERLQLQLRDERHTDRLKAKCAIVEAESGECRAAIERDEAGAWDLLDTQRDSEHDVAQAHDRRSAAMLQRQAYLRERDERLQHATTLLQATAMASVVRRRLGLVARCPVEARAICADEHRQTKQILQGEVISWMDVLQYYVITAPDPVAAAVHAPHAVVSPDCVASVEALARRRIALDHAASMNDLAAYDQQQQCAARTLAPEFVGKRTECAKRVQAVWRGFKLRVFFQTAWRDELVFARMRRVKARMALRAEQDIEELHRLNLVDDEAKAFAKVATVAHPEGLRMVARRLECAIKVQAAYRGYRHRRHVLPRIKEDFWLRRYNASKEKQRARTAPLLY